MASALSGAALLAARTAWAVDEKFSLSTDFDHSSGNFGTASTIDTLSSIPVTGRLESGHWVFKLSAPYARIPGTGVSTPANTIQSGLVEPVAAATYNIYGNSVSNLGLDLTGKVKLNLADKFYGLGSVQNDYAAQADAYQKFDKFKALGSLGYKVEGNPAGISMNKILYGSIGGAYQLNEQVSGGFDFSLSQSPSLDAQGQRHLSAYVSHNINNSLKARGYVLKGVSDSSQDRSVGAAVSYGF
jgi:hypothetical protein